MKVYVTHQKDGYGGEMIAEIFDTAELAQDWVIARHYTGVFYSGRDIGELRNLANEFVDEHDVLTANLKLRGAPGEKDEM